MTQLGKRPVFRWKMSLRIAILYDLKSDYEGQEGLKPEDLAELDTEDVIEGIETALTSLGHNTIRIGRIQNLVQALARNEQDQWDLAWNISEGFYGTAREAQVPGLLEAYQVPYTFSDAATLALVHDKVLTKIVLDHHGVSNAPFTVIVARKPFTPRTTEQWQSAFPGIPIFTTAMPALFVKPAMEGSSKGIYDFCKASSADALNAAVKTLRLHFADQDLLVETFLGGREFTVSLLSTGPDAYVLGSIEHGFAPGVTVDFFARSIKEDDNVLTSYLDIAKVDPTDPLVQAAEALALQAWRALGCRDGGRVDVRCQGHGEHARPFVMEVNALAGMRRNKSAITMTAKNYGMSFESLVETMLASAVKRLSARSQDL